MRTITCTLLTILAPFFLFGNHIVKHQDILQVNVDLSEETILGEITINPTTPGTVVVHFDGYCVSTPGDRIILAASDTPSWNVNSGNVGVEAFNNDLNRNGFSHTRVYEVGAGSQTYYAVGHNFVETDGDGVASVYGMLTVEFFPDSDEAFVEDLAIEETNIDLNDLTTLGEININPGAAGKVIVHFDGSCSPSVGDRIILAASDTPSWGVNSGNVAVEVPDNDINRQSFSHTRVYNVGAGSHTFYAVAQNFVETAGDGIASVYGTLTVEFIPTADAALLESQIIEETNLDVTNETTIGEITINPSMAGTVIAHFDGYCASSPGDRIILAAGDIPSWETNSGHVSMEAISDDINRNSFSHTRVYDVSAGSHTFYAVAHNWVETDGDGEASIYGILTVRFIPEVTVHVAEIEEATPLTFFPNPTTGMVQFSGSAAGTFTTGHLQIMDVNGRILETVNPASLRSGELDLTNYPAGMYFVQWLDESQVLRGKGRIIKVSE